MLRNQIYLLAFVIISVFGVALLLGYRPQLPNSVSTDQTIAPTTGYNVSPTPPIEQSSRPSCTDPVSEMLVSKMLEEPEIAEGLRNGQFDCSENLKHTQIDLNGDGRDEHFVWMYVGTMCGSKSNCPTAIFSETPSGLRRTYYHPAKLKLKVLNSKANGYFEVESAFNEGVYGQYIEILRFNGDQYQRSKCLDRYPDESEVTTECWELD